MIPLRVLLVSGALFSLIFLAFPGIDLWANGKFYQPGQGFSLAGDPFYDFIHDEVGYLAWAFLLSSLLAFLISFLPVWPRIKSWRWPGAFLLIGLLLGPGLLVNAVFKEEWGRARPMDVQEFGGTKQFSPAWVITDQCARNCSFVCGDSSVGYALMLVAFVSRRPRFWLGLGLAVGTALGIMRMGQGGHFLSDVIFSFYAVYLTGWALHRVMVRMGLLPDPPRNPVPSQIPNQ